MKRLLKPIPIVALAVAGVLLSLQIARGQTAVVAVSPASKTVAPTAQFTLDVTVSAVQGLHAANVRVTFNKTILQYDQVTLGSFLPAAYMPTPTVYSGAVYDTIDVDQGILGADSISGSGVLLSIQFTALTVGTTAIGLPTADLRTPSNLPIGNTRQDGQVIVSLTTVANVKVFLEGPFNGTGMNVGLRTAGLVPLSQPYSGAPWNYAGSEHVTTVPAGVVDWVLVQLRSNTTTTVATRAAFLKSDGTVVDTNGTSAVGFPSVGAGNYYIVVRHRNHLAIMSAATNALNESSALYDFTTGQAKTYGVNAMKQLATGVFGLCVGDANGDGFVTNLDFNVFNPKFTTAATGYQISDWNMDGFVTNLDFNLFNPNFTTAKQTQVP